MIKLRYGLGVAVVVVLLVTLGWAVWGFVAVQNAPLAGFALRDFNAPYQLALEAERSRVKEMAQLALVILGALWAMLIAKRDEHHIQFADKPEIAMVLASHAAIAASLWCSWQHEAKLREFLLWSAVNDPAEIPDFADPRIAILPTIQAALLVVAVLAAAAALISAAQFKPAIVVRPAPSLSPPVQ